MTASERLVNGVTDDRHEEGHRQQGECSLATGLGLGGNFGLQPGRPSGSVALGCQIAPSVFDEFLPRPNGVMSCFLTSQVRPYAGSNTDRTGE